jgi:ech hydrogenase subunit C
MPQPKFVMAVGTCACSGGVFQGCYNVKSGIDAVLPVSVYVPGCPASPNAIIDGVVKLLGSLTGKEIGAIDDPERERRFTKAC